MPADGQKAIALTKNERMSDAPTKIFVDTLMQAGVGSFVSKLVLGVQTGPSASDPVVEITMPANALLALAQHVIALYGDANVVERTKAIQAKYQKEIASLPGVTRRPAARRKPTH